eukprot:scaffold844_cov139-Isochrysis_galbana.AAC.3
MCDSAIGYLCTPRVAPCGLAYRASAARPQRCSASPSATTVYKSAREPTKFARTKSKNEQSGTMRQ